MKDFIDIFCATFIAGGFLMYPIVALAFYLYFSGFEVCFRMRRWNRICADDILFSVAFRRFLNSFVRVPSNSSADVKKIFTALRRELSSGVDRRLRTLKILSSVAPLIGLLGTVSGMMLSISAAARDSKGVAEGISCALITTQAGLVAAIPAWIIAMFAAAQTQKLMINLSAREAAMVREKKI